MSAYKSSPENAKRLVLDILMFYKMHLDSKVLSLVFLPALCFALQYDPSPTATIDAGVLIGKATTLPNGLGPSVNQFLGVPFAQSPPERFSPPRNVTAFSKRLNATEWKPACIQQFRCKFLEDIHT
jgi:hypothetical protein